MTWTVSPSSRSWMRKLAVAALIAPLLAAAPAIAHARDGRASSDDERLLALAPRAAPGLAELKVSQGFYARALERHGALRAAGLTGPLTAGSWEPARVAPAYVNAQGKPVGGYLWALAAD